MKYFLLTFCLFCIGCGSDCDPEDIDGTYRAVTTEVSGNCGDIGTFAVQYDKGTSTTDTGCVMDYERFSEDQCTADRSVTCVSTADNIRTSGVGSITQEPGGENITGTMTVTVRNLSNGTTLCVGTYDVAYSRM